MPTPMALTPHQPSSTNPTTPIDPQVPMTSSLLPSVESHNNPESIAPFPHPSTFTFLPDLYNIISRLSILNSTLQSNTNDDNTINTTASNQTPITPSATQSRDNTKPAATQESTPLVLGLTKTNSKESHIDIKDLPSLIYTVRHKIQDAKEVVINMQDIERDIETQDTEIQMLERKVRALKGRLSELGQLAGRRPGGDNGVEVDSLMMGVED